jgi:glutathione synthase/RimK-type ligase-like ATP-grasp enzyme
MTIKIYSHNYGAGSRNLAEAMGVKILLKEGSRWRPRPRDKVINWGATRLPQHLFDAEVINHPDLVASVVDKRNFFLQCDGTQPFNVPRYWTSRDAAEQWLRENPGRTLVARTILRGHEGAGIVLIDSLDQMVNAPLYTEYVKKKAEYRVHVVNGVAIDAVQKKKLREYDGARDTRIRNTLNGYVFARTGVVVPQCVLDNAVAAVTFYGLHFGAVDVIYNEHQDKAYVLEINTAPGIEGTTVQKYKEAFQNWLN